MKPSRRLVPMPARRAVPAATSDGGWHHHNHRSPRKTWNTFAFLIVAAVVYYFVGKLILLIAGFILFVRGNSGGKGVRTGDRRREVKPRGNANACEARV